MKFFLSLSLFVLSCNVKDLPENPYYHLFNHHKVTNISYYTTTNKWEDHIMNITPEHIDFILQINKIDGFIEKPIQTEQFAQIASRTKKLSSTFHPAIKELLNRYLLGVYFCENLGGTGISGIVYKNNQPVGGFIILDAVMINQKANDWISSKENSAFTSKNTHLQIMIEQEKNNTHENALRYILLHEFGHILSVVEKQVPDFREKKRDFSLFPFMKDIWKTETSTIYDTKFPIRQQIHFYSQKKVDLDKHWQDIYPTLEKTSFPTLYSATHPDEYFADSFVSFVHVAIDHRPWDLVIKQNGKEVYRYQNDILKDKFHSEIIRTMIFLTK